MMNLNGPDANFAANTEINADDMFETLDALEKRSEKLLEEMRRENAVNNTPKYYSPASSLSAASNSVTKREPDSELLSANYKTENDTLVQQNRINAADSSQTYFTQDYDTESALPSFPDLSIFNTPEGRNDLFSKFCNIIVYRSIIAVITIVLIFFTVRWESFRYRYSAVILLIAAAFFLLFVIPSMKKKDIVYRLGDHESGKFKQMNPEVQVQSEFPYKSAGTHMMPEPKPTDIEKLFKNMNFTGISADAEGQNQDQTEQEDFGFPYDLSSCNTNNGGSEFQSMPQFSGDYDSKNEIEDRLKSCYEKLN